MLILTLLEMAVDRIQTISEKVLKTRTKEQLTAIKNITSWSARIKRQGLSKGTMVIGLLYCYIVY